MFWMKVSLNRLFNPTSTINRNLREGSLSSNPTQGYTYDYSTTRQSSKNVKMPFQG